MSPNQEICRQWGVSIHKKRKPAFYQVVVNVPYTRKKSSWTFSHSQRGTRFSCKMSLSASFMQSEELQSHFTFSNSTQVISVTWNRDIFTLYIIPIPKQCGPVLHIINLLQVNCIFMSNWFCPSAICTHSLIAQWFRLEPAPMNDTFMVATKTS